MNLFYLILSIVLFHTYAIYQPPIALFYFIIDAFNPFLVTIICLFYLILAIHSLVPYSCFIYLSSDLLYYHVVDSIHRFHHLLILIHVLLPLPIAVKYFVEIRLRINWQGLICNRYHLHGQEASNEFWHQT